MNEKSEKGEMKGKIIRIIDDKYLKTKKRTGIFGIVLGCFLSFFLTFTMFSFENLAIYFLLLLLGGILPILIGFVGISSGYQPMIIHTNGIETPHFIFFKKSRYSYFIPFKKIRNVNYIPETKTINPQIEVFLKNDKKQIEIINNKSDFEIIKKRMMYVKN